MHRRSIVTVLALLMLLAACAGGGEESGSDGGGGAQPAALADEDSVEAGAAADSAGAAGGERAADASSASGAGDLTLASSVGDRIVREGTMRIEVGDDAFDRAFADVIALAGRFGGTVLSSDATTTDDDITSGSITLRVPAPEYDGLLVAAGRIGEVRRRSITSQDVTDEFVDLEARLRHNQAQERFYLSLLDDAKNVRDAIAVQQRMDGIQQSIEQIQGRLRFLEERTDFSRLTVELAEAGAAFQVEGPVQPSFAHYWATARAALVNVLGGALVVATVMTPFVMVGVLVLLAVRRYGMPRRDTVATPET